VFAGRVLDAACVVYDNAVTGTVGAAACQKAEERMDETNGTRALRKTAWRLLPFLPIAPAAANTGGLAS
jgi:hypothetical protein